MDYYVEQYQTGMNFYFIDLKSIYLLLESRNDLKRCECDYLHEGRFQFRLDSQVNQCYVMFSRVKICYIIDSRYCFFHDNGMELM